MRTVGSIDYRGILFLYHVVKGKNVKNYVKKCKIKLELLRKDEETRKEYYGRLDQQAAEKVAEIMMKERRVSQKRKE